MMAPALHLALALILVAGPMPAAVLAQEAVGAPKPATLVQETILLELAPDEATGGSAAEIIRDVEPSGPLTTVYLHALHPDLDLALRITRPDGTLVGEDEDEGGVTTPFLELEFESPARLCIQVTCPARVVSAPITLSFAQAHESTTTLAAAETADGHIAEFYAAYESGEREAARRATRDSIELLRNTPGALASARIGQRLWSLGYYAFEAGAFRSAAAARSYGVQRLEPLLPPDHNALLSAYRLHAQMLRTFGDVEKAATMAARALRGRERTLHPDDPVLQVARLDLAGCLHELGDLEGARALTSSAVDVYARTCPRDDHGRLQAQIHHARDLAALGDVEQARSMLTSGVTGMLTIPPRRGVEPVSTFEELDLRHLHASVLEAIGDIEAAAVRFEDLVGEFERALSTEHPRLQLLRREYAALLFRLGDSTAATQLLRRVLEAQEVALPPDHPAPEATREALARIVHAEGDSAQACALLEQVLEVRSRILPQGHPDRLESLARLVELRAELAKDRESSEYVGSLLPRLGRELRAGVQAYQAQLSERGATSLAASWSDHLSVLLSLQPLVESDLGEDVLEEVMGVMATLRCAAENGHRLRRLTHAAGTPEGDAAAQLLDELAMASHSLDLTQADFADVDGMQDAVGRKERLEERLSALLSGDPRAAQLLEPVSTARLAAGLRPGEAAVGYWIYDHDQPRGEHDSRTPSVRKLVALVLRADGGVERVDLGPVAPIDDRIETWRQLACAHDKTLAREVEEVGILLRNQVVDPVLDAAGKVDRLWVALDGALHLLPMDCLPGRATPGGSVGDEVELCTLTALRDLRLTEGGADPGAPGLLAMGDVDYGVEVSGEERGTLSARLRGVPGAASGEPLGDLPWTGKEVSSLAATFSDVFERAPQPLLFTGELATREAFIQAAPGCRYLHLATHAWFAPDSIRSMADVDAIDATAKDQLLHRLDRTIRGHVPAMLCGIAFAGAGTKNAEARKAGILTGYELSRLDLGGCELAVLSACETGRGARRPGQGVASLQQSLHSAGARMSLTSLWEVEDEATQLLMSEFYRRLWSEQEPPNRALWAAKRTLRDAKDRRGRPRFPVGSWAGWVLCGVPPGR